MQRELEVLCSKNIIRNLIFIPVGKIFWLSGTADRAITYIRLVELNGNREHENKIKEIPLLINFSKCVGYRGQQIGLHERFLPKKYLENIHPVDSQHRYPICGLL